MGNNGAIMELHNNSTHSTMTTEPAHTVKHICNSHKPTRNKNCKRASLFFQRFFADPKNKIWSVLKLKMK